ncbi:type II toxin-antitoxin system prevent-host-death family antitoxin [Methylocapsa sp. S129]|uniref:type II toxin-antitoxin system prevent-host-death family antitoxin n=1 Tax=Methylocapsa sp. S129 TaxID=1641869 RepID=UPI00131BED1C|nr:type II toxin-antitoxin system prevent-host-death family antitoxin [Methylocapsa sp. S129]
MNRWPVHEAKARFTELLETCLKHGPQVVTRDGAEIAVLAPVDEWLDLQQSARPTLKELLLAEKPRANIPVLKRGQQRRRQAPRFD